MAIANKSTLKRAKNPMPAFVQEALDDRGLMNAYRARLPYQQNDYLGWIGRRSSRRHFVVGLESMRLGK
jgi:hypothetical protein